MADLSPTRKLSHGRRARRLTLIPNARAQLRVAALAAVVTAVLVASVLIAAPAGATVPGPNGRIAFARFDSLIGDDATYTANPDGSHVKRLFPGAPSWRHIWTHIFTATSFAVEPLSV